MTRIGIDVTPLAGEPTGIGMFTRGLIGALARRRDMEVVGFAMTAAKRSAFEGRLPQGSKLHRYPRIPASVLLRTWPRAGRPTAEWWTGDVDVVHGTNYLVPPAKSASILTVHDLTGIRYPQMCTAATLRYPQNIVAAVGRGAHIHTLTHAVAREVETFLQIDPTRIHVVSPGLPGISAPLVTSQTARRFVLAIGTIEPRKDYPMLLRAFDKVASSCTDVDLVIAGSPGWAMDDFDRALATMTHRDRVRLLGRVTDEERISLLQSASVLAFPSIYEGFGLPPLEAMQLGIPVVATRTEAVEETSGEAVLSSEISDDEAFADNLVKALEDQEVRARLVEAGKIRAGLFNWVRSGDKLAELYTELQRSQQ